jgi:hypothetical protein
MPVPDLTRADLLPVIKAVRDYLDAVSEHVAPTEFRLQQEDATAACKELQWRIDAEILRLFALPIERERELLDFFAGWARVGVPFKQDRYLPEHFDEPISLVDYIAITTDWDATNRRRLELIEKKQSKSLSDECGEELRRLQRLAGLKRELHSSPSLKELADMEADLRRRGLWRGA